VSQPGRSRRPRDAEPAPPLSRTDRLALATLHETLLDARGRGETQPPFALFASCLSEIGVILPEQSGRTVSLEQAREEWLRRLRSAGRSASTLSAYRVALDDLLDFLDRSGSRPNLFSEETIVAHLTDCRRRARPACATYYRRFMLLRRFFRWLSRRTGVPDPFLDLEPPGKPQHEADWLTAEEFERLLQAASSPRRRRLGLAERDRLVLLTLVATGLRRSELLALNWGALDLDSERPSLLVRCGKGGKPRRQPLALALARELGRRRAAVAPSADEPVFCGLEGRRLQRTILGLIIRRAAERAGLEKRVTAHTLRHTAATWLRQETGDARLVAAYLGHADLSTVSRYAHVAADELHAAADAIAKRSGIGRSS
jgi:site-specific recombinase XerD